MPGFHPNTVLVSAGPAKNPYWTIWYERSLDKSDIRHHYKKPSKPIIKPASTQTQFNPAEFTKVALAKDREWRKLIWRDSFRLQSEEIAELQRRGVTKWGSIPFVRTYPGLGIPILTPPIEGKPRLIAMQHRRLRGEGSRYQWFNYKYNPLLNDPHLCDQIPIGFYGDPETEYVILCEGYLKAAISYLRYDDSTIGVGSHANISISYNLIKHYLDSLKNLQFIYIAPDSNIFTNPRIQASIFKCEELLKQDFPHLYINLITWDQHEEYDIDERPAPSIKVTNRNHFLEKHLELAQSHHDREIDD